MHKGRCAAPACFGARVRQTPAQGLEPTGASWPFPQFGVPLGRNTLLANPRPNQRTNDGTHGVGITTAVDNRFKRTGIVAAVAKPDMQRNRYGRPMMWHH